MFLPQASTVCAFLALFIAGNIWKQNYSFGKDWDLPVWLPLLPKTNKQNTIIFECYSG